MNPFVGEPYNGANPETWGKTNYYKMNDQVVSNPMQTRIGGRKKLRKKSKKIIKKHSRKSKKYLKKNIKKSKKGGGLIDQRFPFPGLNTARSLMNSTQNAYNTLSGKHLNVSPNPLNQPIHSGST